MKEESLVSLAEPLLPEPRAGEGARAGAGGRRRGQEVGRLRAIMNLGGSVRVNPLGVALVCCVVLLLIFFNSGSSSSGRQGKTTVNLKQVRDSS